MNYDEFLEKATSHAHYESAKLLIEYLNLPVCEDRRAFRTNDELATLLKSACLYESAHPFNVVGRIPKFTPDNPFKKTAL